MSVTRGTTPDFVLSIDDYDITGKRAFVTISQANRKITKTDDELSIEVVTGEDDQGNPTITSEIGLQLSQEDTLYLTVGNADVQVRMIDATGYADATDIGTFKVTRVLLEKVISYADNTP